MSIQPLTHTTKTGEPYYRREQVLRQIESLVDASEKELLTRAHIEDKDNPDYIQEETLVYWIREHHRQGDRQVAEDLSVVLLVRSARYIRSKLHGLGQDSAQEAAQDVLSKMFEKIFDLDTDLGDYLQVSYWDFVGRLITSTFKKYARHQNRTEYLSSPDDNDDSSDDNITEGVGTNELVAADVAFEQQALIQSALATLDEKQRTAFVLHYYHGWPIESKDASAITISRYFKRDPRTIRNWLEQAKQLLSEWQNEERS